MTLFFQIIFVLAVIIALLWLWLREVKRKNIAADARLEANLRAAKEERDAMADAEREADEARLARWKAFFARAQEALDLGEQVDKAPRFLIKMEMGHDYPKQSIYKRRLSTGDAGFLRVQSTLGRDYGSIIANEPPAEVPPYVVDYVPLAPMQFTTEEDAYEYLERHLNRAMRLSGYDEDGRKMAHLPETLKLGRS